MSAVRVMPLPGGDSAQLRLMGALMRQQRAAGTWPPPGPAQPPDPARAGFTVVDEDHYRMVWPRGITFDLSHVRREQYELRGELCVLVEPRPETCGLGIETTADFSVSSGRSREEWIRRLSARTDRVNKFLHELVIDIDWYSVMESFCKQVRIADRDAGAPVVDLRTLPAPAEDQLMEVEGIPLARRLPNLIFGDNASLKTYLALLIAGRLAERGERVLLCDWELDQDVHRGRLERLFGKQMPELLYLRCDRPLAVECDRVRSLVKQHGITFCVFDSVGYASNGPPEAAEVANEYLRCVRRIGSPSLHVGHINRAGDTRRAFGSIFWDHGARSTWYAEADQDLLDERVVHLKLKNQKASLGKKREEVICFNVTFGQDSTTFARVEIGSGAREVDSKTPELTELLRANPGIGTNEFEALAQKQGLGRNKARAFLRNGESFGSVRREPADDGKTLLNWLVEAEK